MADITPPTPARSRFQVEEEQVRFVVMFFDELPGACREKQFQGRPYSRMQQVPAAHLAVGEPDRAVRVDRRLAIDQADIPDE